MDASPSLWSSLGSLAGLLGGISVLWGALLNWRRQPAEHRLITVQADATEATRDKTRAEAESLAVASIERALIVAERRLDRVQAEKDRAEEREKMLEVQLEREVEWRKANGWPPPPSEGG